MKNQLAKFMPKRNTVLAAAIVAALAGSAQVMAATSTVGGAFILDKNAISAGGRVNLSLMGLDATGVVDQHGSDKGSVIYAEITTELGTIGGLQVSTGSDGTSGSSSAPGAFARDVKYVRLTQGLGKVYIDYPSSVSGTDTVKIKLFERFETGNGGYQSVPIAGAETTESVTIAPVPSSVKKLDIIEYKNPVAETKAPITSDTVTTDGIDGGMTAGIGGGQVTMQALKVKRGTPNTTTSGVKYDANGNGWVVDTNASGNAKLDLISVYDGETKYSVTAQMNEGVAIFTLGSDITKALAYYMKGTVEGYDNISTIDMYEDDTFVVFSTNLAKKLKLYSGKSRISNNQDAMDSSKTSVIVSVLDEYGNTASVDMGGKTVKLTDSNQIVSNSQVTFPAGSKSTSFQVGGSGALLTTTEGKIGATSLTGTIENQTTIAASDVVAVNVVDKGLLAEVYTGTSTLTPADMPATSTKPSFTGPMQAGQPFRGFKVVSSGSTAGSANENLSANGPATVSLQHYVNGAVTETNTFNLNKDENILQVLLNKASKFDPAYVSEHYMLSDASSLYGQVQVSNQGNNSVGDITPAPASVVSLLNGHGEVISTLPIMMNASSDKYVSEVPEKVMKIKDAYGNSVSSGNEDTVNVKSTLGSASLVGGNGVMIPGATDGTIGLVEYVASGANKVSGDDTVTLSFNTPGLGTTDIKTTVPEMPYLDKIVANITQTAIPVNGEVAVTLETVDQFGKLYNDPKSVNQGVNITWTATGTSPAIVDNDTNKSVANGENLIFSTTIPGRKVLRVQAGPTTGSFSLAFKNADDKSASKEFTVTSTLVQSCASGAESLCKTETECTSVGGAWDGTACAAPTTPVAQDSLGSAEIGDGGTPAIVDLKGNEVAKDAPNVTWTGGIAVNGGARNKTARVTGADELKVNFTAKVPDALVGKKADVAVVILWMDENTPPGGVFLWWNGDKALVPWQDLDMTKINQGDMTPFKTVEALGAEETVEVFSGKLANLPGTAVIFTGFITEDKLYFNGTKPENFVTLSIAK